jgi:hypothetical protein
LALPGGGGIPPVFMPPMFTLNKQVLAAQLLNQQNATPLNMTKITRFHNVNSGIFQAIFDHCSVFVIILVFFFSVTGLLCPLHGRLESEAAWLTEKSRMTDAVRRVNGHALSKDWLSERPLR